jgi:ATP-dependent exoDNAse (exonuclease V) beta subunit
VALPVPAPYSDWAITEWAIEESLPDTVAAFVDWVVGRSGWTVVENDVRVPVAPRHVCILFRRFRSFWKDMTHDYVRALEARHLKHLLVGGTSFHAREEVEAVRNALAAIERPEDELAVFATLRGPFFALGDAALLAFRARWSLHPFRRVPDDVPEALREVAVALAILRDLHRERNRRPLADTIGRLLAATRAHAGLAIWPTGEQALANVTRLLDLARRAERNGAISFRSFVDHLADQAERGEASDAPIVEEGTEGVRIMTVHRAKGLEFPIVVLADLGAAATRDEPTRWVDNDRRLSAIRLAGCAPPELLEHAAEELAREREEAERLLYVAATRARDLLVVTAVSDARHAGWVGALDPAVYPAAETAQAPETQAPTGCPAFGDDCIRTRPDRIPRPAPSVSPGLHRPEAGAHRVVWWDPAVLALGAQETVGLKQKKLLEADESGTRSEEGTHTHARWQEERVRVRAAGRVASVRVSMATEHAAASGEPADDVAVESVGGEGERPHGRRFGTLVHAVLASIELDAERAAVEAVAAWQGRIVGATAAEIDAAAEAAHRALGHPLLVRAAAASRAGRCRRETPVSVRLDDGALVEGVIDAAFVEDGVWTVVDWKTDVEIAGRMAEYRRQVGLYGRAIAAATGMPARAVLLRV